MSGRDLREAPSFEALIGACFSRARQGAVLVVEARSQPAARFQWLGRHLSTLVPTGVVHHAGDGLLVITVRDAGPAESWLLVERLRRHLTTTGWERTIVASANWPVQGSSPMDVVAAALASLFDERARVETELSRQEVWVEMEGQGCNWASESDLLSG